MESQLLEAKTNLNSISLKITETNKKGNGEFEDIGQKLNQLFDELFERIKEAQEICVQKFGTYAEAVDIKNQISTAPLKTRISRQLQGVEKLSIFLQSMRETFDSFNAITGNCGNGSDGGDGGEGGGGDQGQIYDQEMHPVYQHQQHHYQQEGQGEDPNGEEEFDALSHEEYGDSQQIL